MSKHTRVWKRYLEYTLEDCIQDCMYGDYDYVFEDTYSEISHAFRDVRQNLEKLVNTPYDLDKIEKTIRDGGFEYKVVEEYIDSNGDGRVVLTAIYETEYGDLTWADIIVVVNNNVIAWISIENEGLDPFEFEDIYHEFVESHKEEREERCLEECREKF